MNHSSLPGLDSNSSWKRLFAGAYYLILALLAISPLFIFGDSKLVTDQDKLVSFLEYFLVFTAFALPVIAIIICRKFKKPSAICKIILYTITAALILCIASLFSYAGNSLHSKQYYAILEQESQAKEAYKQAVDEYYSNLEQSAETK